MARRKAHKGIMEQAAESPAGAIVLIVFGFLFWGPLPEIFIKTIYGGQKAIDSGSPDMFGNAMSNAYMGGFLMAMPWAEVAGMAMIAAGFVFLSVHANKKRIKHPKINKNHLMAFFAVAAAVSCYLTVQAWGNLTSPDANHERMAAFQDTMTPDIAPGPRSSADTHLPDQFPPSGTTIWGSQGQPISGSLSTISVWDVTGSPQDKVIRIRRYTPGTNGNHTEPVVTLFLAAGEHHEIKLKPGLYDVVAGSASGWDKNGFKGPVAVVSFGTINAAAPSVPAVVAMGAPDQEASIVDGSWF